ARVVEAIIERYGSVEGKWCAVYCGKGNNGGDGAVIARLLWMRGAIQVWLFLFGRVSETKGEARTNFEIAKQISEQETAKYGVPRFSFLEITENSKADGFQAFNCDLVIDALLGTGLMRPIEGLYAEAIDAINKPK